jgi:hypothetical protein
MEEGLCSIHCWEAGAVLALAVVVVVVVRVCHVDTKRIQAVGCPAMSREARATDFNSELGEHRLALLAAVENTTEVQMRIGRGRDWPSVRSIADDESSGPRAHRAALSCAVPPEIPNDQDGQGNGHQRHVITRNDEGETPKTVHFFQKTAWLDVDLISRGGSCGPMDKPAPSIQIPVRAARVTTVNDEGDTPKVVHVYERAWIEQPSTIAKPMDKPAPSIQIPVRAVRVTTVNDEGDTPKVVHVYERAWMESTREEGRLAFARSEALLQAPVPSSQQEEHRPAGHGAIEACDAAGSSLLSAALQRYHESIEESPHKDERSRGREASGRHAVEKHSDLKPRVPIAEHPCTLTRRCRRAVEEQ